MFKAKRRKRKLAKIKSRIILILLTAVLYFSFAIPAYSQSDILTTSAQKISATEAWWDDLWESTFNPPSLTELSSTPVVATPPPTNSTFSLPGTPLPVPSLPPTNSGSNLPAPPPPGAAATGQNLSIYAFTSATRTILAIALIFWLFSYGRALVESPTMAQSIHVFVKLFIPIVIALLFISDQGRYSRVLAQGMRSMVNSWSNGVMNLTLVNYSMRAAIQDQLLAADAKERIINAYLKCENINPPEVTLPSLTRPDPTDPNAPQITDEQRRNYDYLDCLTEVKNLAQAEKTKAEDEALCSGFLCKAYGTVSSGISAAMDAIEVAERERRTGDGSVSSILISTAKDTLIALGFLSPVTAPISGVLTVTSSGLIGLQDLKNVVVSFVNPSKSFLYFTQWMWVSTLEMAMFLNGLFAPMFFSVSIIPGKERMVNFFLIEFLTIGLAKMAYVLIIGIVAIQISTTGTGLVDDTFFMTMGIFAPAVSFAVVTAGGLAAASSYKSQSVGAVSAVAGLASSGAATIAYSMSRAADKHR